MSMYQQEEADWLTNLKINAKNQRQQILSKLGIRNSNKLNNIKNKKQKNTYIIKSRCLINSILE